MPDSNVLVAYTGNHTVEMISPDGQVSTVAGQPGRRGIVLGPLPATLYRPTDVSVDPAGDLLVGSQNAILRIRLNR